MSTDTECGPLRRSTPLFPVHHWKQVGTDRSLFLSPEFCTGDFRARGRKDDAELGGHEVPRPESWRFVHKKLVST